MMQLYCLSGGTSFQPWAEFSTTFITPETTGTSVIGRERSSHSQTRHLIVNTRVCGTSGLSSQAIRTTRVLPGQREQSRPKHDVTEGTMTLAYDMRPEATLVIGLTWYELQRQIHIKIRADASCSTLA